MHFNFQNRKHTYSETRRFHSFIHHQFPALSELSSSPFFIYHHQQALLSYRPTTTRRGRGRRADRQTVMAYARQVELVDLSNTRSLRPTVATARVLDTSPRTSASSLAAAAGTGTSPPLSRFAPTTNTSNNNNNNNNKANYSYYTNSNNNNNTASSNRRDGRYAAAVHHGSPSPGSPRRPPAHAPPPPLPAEPSQSSPPQQRHNDGLSPRTGLSIEQREDMFRQCLSTSCVDVDELRRIVWAHGMPGTSDTLFSPPTPSSSTPSSPTSATDSLFSTRSKASISSWVRPLTWKLLCGYLPPERSEWASVLAANRARYWAVVHDATIDPSARPMDGDHPLSESDTSQWREFFRDADVRALIARDAQRTHADLSAVHQRIRDPLERLLFVYAKNHPNPGYRQGMNELAAPFLIVFAQEIKGSRSTASSTFHQQQQQQGGFGFGFGGGGGMGREGIDFDYVTTLSDVGMLGIDESDVEADAYFCFCKIMKEMITCYVQDTPSPPAAASASSSTSPPISSVSASAGNHHSMAISPMLPMPKPNSASLSSTQPTTTSTSTSTSSSASASAPDPVPSSAPNAQQQQGIGRQLRELQALLRIKDPKLEGRLDSLGIDPRFYGLRWIRLWLSHEFKLPDCLCLWDSFLTAEVRLPWIRYVCVAMLIRVRDDLLNADFTKCMKMLLNYPPCDVARLLRIADRLRTSNAVIVRTARS